MRLCGMAAALLLAGCATRDVKPTDGEIDRVEAALAGLACVGDPAQWRGHYYYHPKYFGEEVEDAAREGREPRSSGHVRTLIAFDLRQGGDNVAGRVSLGAPLGDGATSAETGVRRALGSYDMRDGSVKLQSCDA
jgi:hypothetical protein